MPGGANGDQASTWRSKRLVAGSSGPCHCVHVDDLLKRVDKLEKADPHPDFWKPGSGDKARRGPDADGSGRKATPDDGDGPSRVSDAAGASFTLPLDLVDPLGTVGHRDKPMFDDKMATAVEFQFNWTKGGLAWMRKVERYFIGRAPVLFQLLRWAETCEDVIDNYLLVKACVRGDLAVFLVVFFTPR